MKALKPKISSTVGGNFRGKHILEAFLSQRQVCHLVKSSKFYLKLYLLTKEHVFPYCIPERLEVNVSASI